MNKFLSASLLLFIAVFSVSFSPKEDGLKWESWNEGYEKGVKEKKIILIDAYTDWCGWCKKMDRDTYSNADIIKKINKHFIPIKFNPELPVKYNLNGQSYSGYELLMMLSNNQRTGYPTTYFLIVTKNRVIIDPGYKNAPDFSKVLDDVIEQSGK